MDGVFGDDPSATRESWADWNGCGNRRLAAQCVGPRGAVVEPRRQVTDRWDRAGRPRVARVHGDNHGGADLVREETLGSLDPEQRPQRARPGLDGGDRHALALAALILDVRAAPAPSGPGRFPFQGEVRGLDPPPATPGYESS